LQALTPPAPAGAGIDVRTESLADHVVATSAAVIVLPG
jgi:hypothetical protein